MITKSDRDRWAKWRRLADEAPPGPWRWTWDSSNQVGYKFIWAASREISWIAKTIGGFGEDIANFIAESRTIVPALLDDIEKLEKEIATPDDKRIQELETALQTERDALKVCRDLLERAKGNQTTAEAKIVQLQEQLNLAENVVDVARNQFELDSAGAQNVGGHCRCGWCDSLRVSIYKYNEEKE